MKRPVPTHYVIVYYLTGKMIFRGQLAYVREIRAAAILDNTAVSGIKKLVNVVRV